MVFAASAVADAIGGAQVPGLFDQDLWLLAASLRGNRCQQKWGALAGHLFISDGADGMEPWSGYTNLHPVQTNVFF